MSEKHRGAFDGVLTLFAVSKAARGKGVGSTFWQDAEAYLQGRSVRRIYLYTDSACTVSFYDRKGFERLESVPFTVHRHGVPYPLEVYLYGKNL